MKLHYRILTEATDLMAFRAKVQKHLNGQVPLAYLQSSTVWAGFHPHTQEMVAGFSIKNDTPHRTTTFIPPEARGETLLRKAEQVGLTEINCFWVEPDLRGTKLSANHWFKVRREYLKSGNPYMILCWDKSNEKLNKMYSHIRFHLVYSGQRFQSQAQNEQTHTAINYALVTRFTMLTAHINPGGFMIMSNRFKKKLKNLMKSTTVADNKAA